MSGYAVVDLETTGFSPAHNHRIAEVAVVLLREDGSEEFRWETLVNPNRDLGPQHVHGISAADVRYAPTFEDIAPDLLDLLSGRAFVAHNASFDQRFINYAYLPLGFDELIGDQQTVCTMLWSSRFLSGASRNLRACCSQIGIPLVDAHRASADADATAKLLQWYLENAGSVVPWGEALKAASETSWSPMRRHEYQACVRQSHDSNGDFVTRLVGSLPATNGSDQETQYLGLLDQAMLDRHLSEREKDMLIGLAIETGLSPEQAIGLHRRYLTDVSRAAWADGVLSEDEIEDLRKVAGLLSLSQVDFDSAIKDGKQSAGDVPNDSKFCLSQGDRIALTGQMKKPRDVWAHEATMAGLEVGESVTKSTVLLVAADPDSLSGKAKKAEKYGIPIVGEDAFAELLAHVVR